MPGRSFAIFAAVLAPCALWAQTVSFLAHRDFPVAKGCCTVVSGDFNGDGKLDLVVAYGAGNLALLPGDGAGGFKPKVDLATVTGTPQRLVASDVNGDGKLDLVVDTGTQTSVLLGRADGTFQAPSQPVSSRGLLFVADLNGDRIPDLGVRVASSALCSGGGLEVHLGNGDGTFQKARECIATGEGMGLQAVVGDFNRDGKPDVAWGSSRSNGAVHVFLGNGDGTFRAEPAFDSPGGVVSRLAAGDLNRDGTPDLVIRKPDEIVVLSGNGDGTFREASTVDLPGTPPFFSNPLTIADFDGDGNPGIATGNAILAGHGDGTFQPPQYFLAGSAAAILAASGDFNGDGSADLIFVDYSVANSAAGATASATTLSVLLNNSRSSSSLALGKSVVTGATSLAPASIGAISGKNLARAAAASTGLTLPTQLGGIRLRVRDGTDTVRLAPLFFVSPSQITFLVPDQTTIGPVTFTIDDGSGAMLETANASLVNSAAPGIFSANGQGRGVAAATAVRVDADGSLQAVPVFDCNGQGQCKAVPIDLAAGGPVYLSLYGTGFRAVQALGEGQPPHASCSVGRVPAAVEFVGAQPMFPGLDQLNLILPASLPSGLASVECVFFIRDVGFLARYPNSNPVQIAIK